jgi:hypothetical protein
MTISDPPPEGGIPRKLTPGNRSDRRGRAGRAQGVRNLRTREADALLAEMGGDPPHIALLKIGRNEELDMSLRLNALTAAAPFFGAKQAPIPAPRFLTESPELGQLTDATSAVSYVAAVAEQVRTGKLDLGFAAFFLQAADLFTRLHERVDFEAEVERARALQGNEDDSGRFAIPAPLQPAA